MEQSHAAEVKKLQDEMSKAQSAAQEKQSSLLQQVQYNIAYPITSKISRFLK
jgi:hypothetical protein